MASHPTTGAMTARLFEDVTVVDVSTYITGGFATMMLANQGAEVIKVERAGAGDPARIAPPFVEGESAYFMTNNYGKRSVELDLKTDRGREILYDLVERADVFVENFRPGVTERLGITDEDLREHREDLIYCSISAFGDSGPWRDRAGFDVLMQGLTGLMDVTGDEDGDPAKVGVPVTDLITASWAAFGVAGALFRREQTGEGDHLELAMYDAVMPWLTMQAAKAFEGQTPTRMGTKHPSLAPYQAFEAADGYLVCGIASEKLWSEFCEAIGRPDLESDDRFATNERRVENVEALEAELEATLAERTVDEWTDVLVSEYGLPVGPIQSVDEALDNEHARARGVVTELDHATIGAYPAIAHPLNFGNAESGFDRHAPVLGADTDEVLESLGYGAAERDELREDGVVGSSDGGA